MPLFRFGEVWDEETRDDGNWMRDGATSFSISGGSELPKLPDLEPEDYPLLRGVPVPEPDAEPAPRLRHVLPRVPEGSAHTTVVSEYLFRPETIAIRRVQAGAGRRALGPDLEQDWEVCQRAQTGVGSRAFTTGVYPRQDRFLYDFNERYRVKMGRAKLGRGPID